MAFESHIFIYIYIITKSFFIIIINFKNFDNNSWILISSDSTIDVLLLQQFKKDASDILI